MSKILVVDDEAGIRELLSEILRDEGHTVVLAENADEARAYRGRQQPDLVLLDIWMPDTDGITLLKEWSASGYLTMPVIMMSGHGTIDTAVEATRIGAFDFLEKPVALQKLLNTVSRALKRSSVLFKPREGLEALGKSTVIADLKKRLDQIVNLKNPVLLMGEPGSGTEHCARFLIKDNNSPFVAPKESGWLTGDPTPILEEAQDGVLFLDSVDSLTKMEQRGLLLMLPKLDKFNVRLVCAANRDLSGLVANGVFDGGLLQALGGLTIHVPPLRAHREDIPELAKGMLDRMIETREVPLKRLSTAALNALRNAEWPGNLHELERVIKTVALTTEEEEIPVEAVAAHLNPYQEENKASVASLPLDMPLREARDIFEKLYFEYHIEKAGGNMSRVADIVGLERTHLYRKLKQLEIKVGKKGE